MYEAHFELTERPFTIAPDPRFLYLGSRHEEALAHLLYGIVESGGFVQLTGEVGTGKTTVIRALLKKLPTNVKVALILNPRLNAIEFVAATLDDLGIPYLPEQKTLKDLVDILNRQLLEAYGRGEKVVLIVDEAQNLDRDVLEQVRLLTNLETDSQKLLQIVLVGQPELRTMLDRDDLRQLSQRITARYHLEPITLDETRQYINHRLLVAGARYPIFHDGAIERIHKSTSGIPRLINVVCDRCLLGAFAQGVPAVTPQIAERALEEVNAKKKSSTSTLDSINQLLSRYRRQAGGLAIGLAATIGGVVALQAASRPESTHSHSAAVAAPLAGPMPMANFAVDADGTAASSSAVDQSLYQTELFRLWNVDYSALPGESTCVKAMAASLTCLLLAGDFDRFQKLNLPGLISFDHSGKRETMAILGTDGDSARIATPSGIQRVPLTMLRAGWPGKFLVLWKSPQKGPLQLKVGDTGKLVSWMRESVQAVAPEEDDALEPSDLFDVLLEQRIQKLQLQLGLPGTGQAGPEFLIMLSQMISESSPKLAKTGRAMLHAER